MVAHLSFPVSPDDTRHRQNVTDNAEMAKEAAAVWEFLLHETAPFMAEAVRVFGQRVLAPDEQDRAPDSQAAAGRRLLHLVFGTRGAGQQLPEALADLVADPDSEQALARLTHHVDATLEADPGMSAAAVQMLSASYRRRADAGEIQALADLGDLLYWDDPEGAGRRLRNDHGALAARLALEG
jgi:hypothetical protein